MRSGASTVRIWALPLAILALACLVIVTDPLGLASRLRGLEFDAYQHARPRLYQDTALRSGHSVKILDIDAASVARFGQWPWPRSTLARLVGELKGAGAALVVLDLPLDTPDAAVRFAQSLPETGPTAGLRAQLLQLPSADDALAGALATMPAVTAFTLGEAGRMPALKSTPNFAGGARPFATIPFFAAVRGALPRIEAASAGVGARNLPEAPDGHIHSVPLAFRLNDTAVPTLDAEVLRLLTGDAAIDITGAEAGLPGLDGREVASRAQAGSYDVMLRPDAGVELYFAPVTAARFVSAADLDAGKLGRDALKGAVVYLSVPDAPLKTPGGLRTRAEIHAEALENMLLGTELRPASTPEAGLAFVIVLGAGLVFLFARGRLVGAGAVAFLAIAAAQGLGWFLFANAQMLLDVANPSAALAAAFVGGCAARQWEVSRARSRLKASFADSLPAKTIAVIARRPALLRLDGETRTVTCLSCGIRRFAGVAEGFADDPAGFTHLVNSAIAPLIEDALNHGGMIARLDGEGFTASWNVPLDDPEHAIHACEAANRMTTTLAEINEQLARERRLDGTAYDPVEIGIGISTGKAIAGGLNAHGRKVYSVTGDATFMADRIRDLSAQYGPAVIVSEDARKAAQRGFAFLEVDFIAAGPRDEPIKLYAMLGNPLVRASPKFRALETFHEHIFQSLRLQQWDKARGLIDQCRKLSGASQKIYDLHLARIAYYESNPPGTDWDGAFRAVLK